MTVLAHVSLVARVNLLTFLFVRISCRLKGEERCSNWNTGLELYIVTLLFACIV